MSSTVQSALTRSHATVTSAPAELARLRPGTHPPEDVLDPTRFLSMLAPSCRPAPRDRAEQLVGTARGDRSVT